MASSALKTASLAVPPGESKILEAALAVAEQAKDDYLTRGVNPSVSLAGHGEIMRHEPFRQLAVHKTNHAIWKRLFDTATASDRKIEFPIAEEKTVKALLDTAKTAEEKVSSAWRRDLAYPQVKEKLAFDKRGRQLTSYGIPLVTPKPLPSKTAADAELAKVSQQAEFAAGEILQAEFQKRAEFLETLEEFKGRIKQAVDSGLAPFSFCNSVVHACDNEKRAMASVMADRCVSELVSEGRLSRAQGDAYAHFSKTASIDISDEGYRIIRGGDNLVIRLNTCIQSVIGNPNRPEKGLRRENGSMVDTDVPYEVEGFYRPRQSRPQIWKGNLLK